MNGSQRSMLHFFRIVTLNVIFLIIALSWYFRDFIIPIHFGILGEIVRNILLIGIDSLLLILYYLFILNGFHTIWYMECFDRIGLVNSIGRTPFLISDISSGKYLHLIFISFGIPLGQWRDKQELIENGLNISISSITCDHSQRIIHLSAVRGRYDWSVPLFWNNSHPISDNSLIVGQSISDEVSLSLSHYPHILIGGATGSGKTYLLKFLLHQCLLHGYSVYISDFKGGVDYPVQWRSQCTMAFEEHDVLSMLTGIITVLHTRMALLSNTQCKDISQYNEHANVKLPRIIFACDEIAELLDERGLPKDNKLIIQEIASKIKTIARLGRAAGIHLILATQRADAEVIPGQIKSNITYRICGTADNMLSMITLDNTDAATMVPKDIPGIFLNQDGTLFKGYLFEEINA